jgi:hypothetical protein
MKEIKIRKYDSINVSPETKKRVDELYYKLKVEKKFKSFDDFIKWLLSLA